MSGRRVAAAVHLNSSFNNQTHHDVGKQEAGMQFGMRMPVSETRSHELRCGLECLLALIRE